MPAMKILLVDDDPSTHKILKKLLKNRGDFVCVEDGEMALQKYFEQLKSKEPFDLVFLDIMIPHIDGMNVLKRIREVEESRGILGPDGVKVVMTSALDDPKSIIGAFKFGCEAYLIKPIDSKTLKSKLKELGLP